MTKDRYLFRGFHKEENGKETIYIDGQAIKGKWVEGLYTKAMFPDKQLSKEFNGNVIVEKEAIKTLSEDTFGTYKTLEVIPETIGQYTELDDKSGKKIFENDIVECKLINQVKEKGKWINKESYENYQVIYSQEDLGFRFKDEWMTIWKFENCELKVIKTIFDKDVK